MDKTRNEQAIQALQNLRDRLDQCERRYPDDKERQEAIGHSRRGLTIAEKWARRAFDGTTGQQEQAIVAQEEENGPQTEENSDGEATGQGDGGAEVPTDTQIEAGERPDATESVREGGEEPENAPEDPENTGEGRDGQVSAEG